MASKYNFKEDLSALTNILPVRIQKFLETTNELELLVEVILDLGRLPEVRFPTEQLSVPGKEVNYEEINTIYGIPSFWFVSIFQGLCHCLFARSKVKRAYNNGEENL